MEIGGRSVAFRAASPDELNAVDVFALVRRVWPGALFESFDDDSEGPEVDHTRVYHPQAREFMIYRDAEVKGAWDEGDGPEGESDGASIDFILEPERSEGTAVVGAPELDPGVPRIFALMAESWGWEFSPLSRGGSEVDLDDPEEWRRVPDHSWPRSW